MLRSSLIILSLLLSGFAFGKGKKSVEHFPSTPALEIRVKFWEKVFNDYHSKQIMIHDLNALNVILTVVDSGKAGDLILETHKKALKDFAKKGAKARTLSSVHNAIYKSYKKDGRAYSRLLSGRAEIRGQAGLSDVFQRAAVRAQTYLPRMEKIFKQHGIPQELTRIAFVESMFNTKAYSKVGASGIWQLMPAAARPHIEVSAKKDERNVPFRATVAAARILRDNHKRLGSWPLAVTAYNHGVNGVGRGVKQVQSNKLYDLILNYRSKSFGFASSNFYAEFLAAKRSYKRWEKTRLTAAD